MKYSEPVNDRISDGRAQTSAALRLTGTHKLPGGQSAGGRLLTSERVCCEPGQVGPMMGAIGRLMWSGERPRNRRTEGGHELHRHHAGRAEVNAPVSKLGDSQRRRWVY